MANVAAEKGKLIPKSTGKAPRKGKSMNPKAVGKSNGKSSRGKRGAATKFTRKKSGKGKKAMTAAQKREHEETATAPPGTWGKKKDGNISTSLMLQNPSPLSSFGFVGSQAHPRRPTDEEFEMEEVLHVIF